MRKYYQALLLVVAVISVISLLFYRHEYNKLHYVLEFLNYFHKPEHRDAIDNCTKSDIKSDFDEPFASWQRLTDNLFVYSSYSKNREIVTIGFGKLRSNFNLNCNVYLETKVVPGRFSYSILKNTTDTVENDEYCGYLLKCELSENTPPIGVTYFQATDNNMNKKSIILSVKQLPEPSGSGYAFCVSPLENRIPSILEVTNFLNTHKLLGVEDFIIYDYGMPVLSDKSIIMRSSWTKVPWNFPFSNIRTRIIISLMELDCVYRTYNKVMYGALVTWEENIVLKYHPSLHNLMIDFKKNKMYGHRFMLKSSVFCMQNNVMGNQKLKTKGRSVYIFKPDDILDNDSLKTMEVLPELVEVKRYQLCSAEQNVKQRASNLRKSFRFSADT